MTRLRRIEVRDRIFFITFNIFTLSFEGPRLRGLDTASSQNIRETSKRRLNSQPVQRYDAPSQRSYPSAHRHVKNTSHDNSQRRNPSLHGHPYNDLFLYPHPRRR